MWLTDSLNEASENLCTTGHWQHSCEESSAEIYRPFCSTPADASTLETGCLQQMDPQQSAASVQTYQETADRHLPDSPTQQIRELRLPGFLQVTSLTLPLVMTVLKPLQ